MNKRVIRGWRRFTTEEHTGRERQPVYDFTELMKAWK